MVFYPLDHEDHISRELKETTDGELDRGSCVDVVVALEQVTQSPSSHDGPAGERKRMRKGWK